VLALLSGLMGALDPGSSNNVFVPMGTWFILVGTIGLHDLGARGAREGLRGAQLLAVFLSFALLAYNPLKLLTSPDAGRSYSDFLATLRAVPGSVYAPFQGYLAPGDYRFRPAAHWVALEDMVRGHASGSGGQLQIRKLLEPARAPVGAAFVLTNQPASQWTPALAPLADHYELVVDYGDRFKALRTLPHRWDLLWPRYLYRHKAPSSLPRVPGEAR
jgi:hypothetical protein